VEADLNDLSNALDRCELVPTFQPIVELLTGQLAGFEVLARWRHPERGLILPKNFISLAEENGLAARLMQQVFLKAFKSAASLPEPLVLAVNVSPCQLLEPSLPSQIRALANEAGFPMRRLHVEITETALVDNIPLAHSITLELKAMGCRLAMDDFGTGYSSLRHLQGLPFDKLKVDRSFVASMTNNRDSRKIVAGIIGLGHSLGLVTVGEGVETEDQADMLQLLGCDMGQGWLYGKPLPAESIPAMVAAAPRTLSSRLSNGQNGDAASGLEALPTQRLAQLQAIYDGAPVGMCFLDTNLRHVSINRRLAKVTGTPPAAYVGRTVKEMLPEFFPRIESYLLRALQGESITDVELSGPFTSRGPSEVTVLASYQPAIDEAGEVIGVSVALVDITDRKRAENALRDSETHYRQMVELNPNIPWALDAQGNVIDFSSRWVELTGLGEEETRNWGWVSALHPDDRKNAIVAVNEAIRTGGSMDHKFRVRAADGGFRWMRSRGEPRRGESGEVIRWYGSLEEIQGYVQAEESLRSVKNECASCEHFPELFSIN
jgi:PAS domain S-box-containing protein